MEKTRILVPLDGSPAAERALAEDLTLSKALQAGVVLLQVVPPIEEVFRERAMTLAIRIVMPTHGRTGVKRWVFGSVCREGPSRHRQNRCSGQGGPAGATAASALRSLGVACRTSTCHRIGCMRRPGPHRRQYVRNTRLFIRRSPRRQRSGRVGIAARALDSWLHRRES
jgi:hypothetical protein